MLPSTQRALLVLPAWILSAVWMWTWWCAQAGTGQLTLYISLTAALFYEYTIIPGALLYFMLTAKLPMKRRAPNGKKVAVITPCVPAQESLDVIERQLKAMADITYPHDSWILDEGGNKDIHKLARKYGVRYFSRKGVAKYNQAVYPFKAKTKAGNINAWLDKTKRYGYEFFVQMDVDHVPIPAYLDKTLGHFRDPRVAWVQAPSVYGNMEFWTARGAAEQDMGMQGPIQMGLFGSTGTPVIIGSHTTFRTLAIRAVGGFQPTRAEDHLNTLALTTAGWHGVFVPEIIASGDGPETLNAYLSQQYAWARSMFQILQTYSWQYLRCMPVRQALQFLFLQTWYPLSTLTFFVLYFVPVVALLLNVSPMRVSAGQFLVRMVPFVVATILLIWAAKPTMQPVGLKLSWRGVILHLIRWPVIAGAILSAVLRLQKPYQITPKGKFLRSVPTLKLYRPFLVLGTISALAMTYGAMIYGGRQLSGQVFFAAYDVLIMLGICLADLNIRLRRGGLRVRALRAYWLKPITAVGCLTLFASFAFVYSFVGPQTKSLVYALHPASVHARDIAHLPPQLLTNEELLKEIASPRYAFDKEAPTPTVGIYKPAGIVQTSGPYIRHSFMDWREDWKLRYELLTSERQGATPLITVEPKGDADGERLLNDIVAGSYDSRLLTLLTTMGLSPNPVYVRFAHEMDLPNVYPWEGQPPSLYVAAYRHVVDLARAHNVNNIRWVWSPAGVPGAEDYYPGDDYVDVVGTTILYDSYWAGSYRPTFYSLQSVRAWLQDFGKPVWIAELCVGNEDPAFQAKLVARAVREFRADGYQALVYLDSRDANVEGPDYRLSDVSVLGGVFVPKSVASTPAWHADVRRDASKTAPAKSAWPTVQLPAVLRRS